MTAEETVTFLDAPTRTETLGDTWEIWLGRQTPAELLEITTGEPAPWSEDAIADAITDYLAGCPWSGETTDAEQDAIAERLIRYALEDLEA